MDLREYQWMGQRSIKNMEAARIENEKFIKEYETKV
ncbi:Mu-like prophage major head subunit gpT family protein [Clostridium sp. DJ247]|nr:Mu-like prophage major head subunit gpT family protein [Clostridium sp. DJ247]